MDFKVFISLLLLFTVPVLKASSQHQDIDKTAFYAAVSSSKQDVIDAQLGQLKSGNVTDKNAYEGTLLMKKAGMVKVPKNKLSLFKSGRSKLEAAIAGDVNNVEYRFLRVIIQENAPKVVKYKSNLDADTKLIIDNFNNLPEFLQQQITSYSKSSKVLKLP